MANLAQSVAWLWRTLPVPVIACVHGVCLGGGLQIALGCDFRFSTATCRFSVMEAKWGLIPDMGGSVLLRELTSIATAKEVRSPFVCSHASRSCPFGSRTHLGVFVS